MTNAADAQETQAQEGPADGAFDAPFEAEVGRVLDLVINSLYKERDIFLRELISNAADSCDKLRYESLARPELLADAPTLEIEIHADAEAGLLTIKDNGLGMNKDELKENLGTIARSGTARFLEAATGDAKSDLKLIGQFGVGFYSAFMAADRVVVLARKAGEDAGWIWASDGRSGYRIVEADRPLERGVTVILHLKDDAKDFLEGYRLRSIVRRYSDHVAIPIMLRETPAKKDEAEETEDGEAAAPEEAAVAEKINEGSALWTRPKSEITEDQYKEFYHHVGHAFDDPYARIHFQAEGSLTYQALLFFPTQRPFDLYDPKRRHGVKLYVRRVFITDELEDLLPRYLRFVSGVVDSEDLELNVSRETLQHGSVVRRIKKAVTSKLLDELAYKAKEEVDEEDESAKDAMSYEEFWQNFGAVLKEGVYEDHDNKDKILKLMRFKTTANDGWTSFEDYVSRMKEGQKDILVITGDSADALRTSPQLEEAKAKGVEVLLLDDPVDDFWLQSAQEFDGKPIKTLTRGAVDLSAIESADDEKKVDEPESEDQKADLERLIAAIKLALGDAVKDVRPSTRLVDSACCLVAEDQGMDMRLERFLKQHNQLPNLSARVLEINAKHRLVKNLSHAAKDDGKKGDVEELAHLLLDQARIIEGEPIPDPGAFSRRMSRFLADAVED